MINTSEIYQTIQMIKDQHLDIRTITLHLSLFDCISSVKSEVVRRVYDKIMRRAGKLKEVGEQIAAKYGIPIINKRVSLSPLSLIGASSGAYLELAAAVDRAAKESGIDFVGGYSALIQKGITDFEREFLYTIPEALAETERVCASVNIGSTRAGINMDAVKIAGELIKKTAELTAESNSIGCAKLVIFANAVEDNPFMAGSFNGIGEGDAVVNVGISGP
ncbi:MAG TPA: DUF711 family protein, partial [Eubacteriales bacterium]|nr:DUF711 family protein [Eubacteriales bacterium]